MKKEKLNLKGIKNALSRGELKEIMAGSGGGGGACDDRPCMGTVYICYDVNCVGARHIRCSGGNLCAPA
ncbi:MAG: hypothetical protein V4577_09900 [Bacteroidota bacterium]